jgi:hypothetical protein
MVKLGQQRNLLQQMLVLEKGLGDFVFSDNLDHAWLTCGFLLAFVDLDRARFLKFFPKTVGIVEGMRV